jgi:hypothetical protein
MVLGKWKKDGCMVFSRRWLVGHACWMLTVDASSIRLLFHLLLLGVATVKCQIWNASMDSIYMRLSCVKCQAFFCYISILILCMRHWSLNYQLSSVLTIIYICCQILLFLASCTVLQKFLFWVVLLSFIIDLCLKMLMHLPYVLEYSLIRFIPKTEPNASVNRCLGFLNFRCLFGCQFWKPNLFKHRKYRTEISV